MFTVFRVKNVEDSEISLDPIHDVKTKEYNMAFQICLFHKERKGTVWPFVFHHRTRGRIRTMKMRSLSRKRRLQMMQYLLLQCMRESER